MVDYPALLRVIVVAYHNPEDLPPLAASLQQHMGLPFELVVWDNGGCASITQTLQLQYADGFRILLGGDGSNLGFGAAVNAAARIPSTSTIHSYFLLNPDAELATPFGPARLAALQARDALTGLQVFDDEARQHRQASARMFPNWMTSVAGREGILTRLFPNNPFSQRYLLNDLPTNGWQKVDWVSGSAIWVSAAQWTRLGGFDERYFLYVEDVDLGRKAQALGVPVYFYPEISVVHRIGGTRKEGVNRRAEWLHHRGMMVYHLKWNGLWGWLSSPVVLPLIVLRFLLRVL